MKGIGVIVILLVAASLNPGYEPAHSWQTPKVTGRWHVKYTLRPNPEKNLIVEVRGDGSATITPLDTGPDEKSTAPQPAIWSQTTMNRINFSAEVELPYGTCCREVGTLMFKGKLDKDDSISGRSVFVTSTTEDENIIGFRSMVGTFTAVRERLSSK